MTRIFGLCLECGTTERSFLEIESNFNVPDVELWECKGCGSISSRPLDAKSVYREYVHDTVHDLLDM